MEQYQREENGMPTAKERKDIKMATIYEIRLLVDAEEKQEFTKDEILKLLDTVARTKEND